MRINWEKVIQTAEVVVKAVKRIIIGK